MSNNHDYLRTSETSRIFSDILGLMMKGAGYAAIACFALLIAWWVLVGVSSLLPPESKEAPDPTPTSSIEVVEPTAFA